MRRFWSVLWSTATRTQGPGSGAVDDRAVGLGDASSSRAARVRRLTAALTDVQRAQLDGLLVVAPGARMTTLAALRQPPRRPTPATFVALAERLQTIRAIGLNADIARQVHQTRLVRLAREGARYSPQFLQRFSPERRYATLVAFLIETSASLTDEAIELHDRLSGQYRLRPSRPMPINFSRAGARSTTRCVCMPASARH